MRETEVNLVKATRTFKGESSNQLSFKAGDKIRVRKKPYGLLWYGTLHKKSGWFPSSYVADIVSESVRDGWKSSSSKSTPVVAENFTLSSTGSSLERNYRTAYRSMILRNLVDSEKKIGRELVELLDLLRRQALFNQNRNAEMEEILQNVIQAHGTFSKILRENLRHPVDKQRIGAEFLKMSSTLSPFLVRYCHKYAVIIEELKKIRNSSTVDQTESISLESRLSLPFRSLQAYPWILRELIEHTDEACRDRMELERAMISCQRILRSCVDLRIQSELRTELSEAKINGWQGEPLNTKNITHISTVESGTEYNGGSQLYWMVFMPNAVLVLHKSLDEPDAFRFEKILHVIGGRICAKFSTSLQLELKSESIENDTTVSALLYFDPADSDNCATVFKSVMGISAEDVGITKFCSLLQDESNRLKTNEERRKQLPTATTSSNDNGSMENYSPSDTRSFDARRRGNQQSIAHRDGTKKRNRSRTRSRSPKRRRKTSRRETEKQSGNSSVQSQAVSTCTISTQCEIRTISTSSSSVSTQCETGTTRTCGAQTNMIMTLGDPSTFSSSIAELLARFTEIASPSTANFTVPNRGATNAQTAAQKKQADFRRVLGSVETAVKCGMKSIEAAMKEDLIASNLMAHMALSFSIEAIEHGTQNADQSRTIKRQTQYYTQASSCFSAYLSSCGPSTSTMNGENPFAGAQPPPQPTANNADSVYKQRIDETIIMEKPNVKFDDVAGLTDAKRALNEAVIFPLRFPQFFKDIEPWKGILLYGPPGTGKSHLAKAVATEAGNWTFFSVSASSLLSKWYGENERMVKELFTQAREKRPSIVFIDEIDSLCSARGDHESETSRRIKTEFMVQLQGVGTNMKDVLILGATNIPWALDPAMRRRFERRIYVPLPDVGGRFSLFKMYLKGALTDSDVQKLADGTEGYSGADINIIARDSKMQRIRTVQSATHFKMLGPNQYVPCRPDDPRAKEMTYKHVLPRSLLAPPITLDDVRNSVEKCKRSVNKQDLVRLLKFQEEFGNEK